MEEMDREAKWNKAMHKFIGCEPSSKVYVIWIIFLLRTVFVPLSIIMGAVALTDENIKTSLPTAIINAGVLEICWAGLLHSSVFTSSYLIKLLMAKISVTQQGSSVS